MLNCEAEKFVNDEKKMSFDKRFCVIRNYESMFHEIHAPM